MGFGTSYSPSPTPPLHCTQTHTPLCLWNTFPRLTPPLGPLMEVPSIPPSNQALAAAISSANTPAFRNRHPPPPRLGRYSLSPSWGKSSPRPGTAFN